MTKKFRCLVCGYIHEGEMAPEECPLCHVGSDQFEEIVETGEDLVWTDEHKLGVAQGVDPEILKGLRDHFTFMNITANQASEFLCHNCKI